MLVGLATIAVAAPPTGGELNAAPQATEPAPSVVHIRGRLRNGTNGRSQRVPRLELIALVGGMRPVATLENVGPTFAFAPIPRPNGPLLLRATYQDQTYVRLVPPVARAWSAQQVVEVFESAALPTDVRPRLALQVTKEERLLRISYIVAMHNRSRTTYRTDRLFLPLPSGAEQVRGSLQHEGSRMPIPLTLERGDQGYRIGRGLRPGNSAITIEFTVAGNVFEHLPPLHAEGSGGQTAVFVWWKPNDAQPGISGGTATTVDTGNLGRALRVEYPAGARVRYDFSAGGFAPPAGPRIERNPLFDSAWKSIAGVLLFALIFGGIVALASSSGLRLVRSPRPEP